MFDALLFDLDGTMLNVDIDRFIQYYFAEIINAADKHGLPGQELVSRIIASTEVMISTKDPAQTNENAFWADLQKYWKYDYHKTYNFFQLFYDQYFPALQKHCLRYPLAEKIMEKAFSKGAKVAMATNSVFPLPAIKMRLEWAGIDSFPYELITSYEIMHYCKPHVQYYEEIAQALQVDPRKCLMIGNDTGEDLIASQAGMKTFLVEDLIIDRGMDFAPDWRGSLADLYDFFKYNYPAQ